jgi:hypothetical protein
MNRKFLDNDISSYETRVVHVLKTLICESDCFLNLHEGSGIYSPRFERDTKNPEKFGQSIIADNSSLTGPSGKITDLEKMAGQVIERINRYITDPDYLFHFNNHRTGAPDTRHKEQLKSATYYAYQTCKIPAFGIECTKTLPLEQKVKQHIYAINGFMEILEIVPQTPGVDLKKPEMQYMIVTVNDSIPVVVGKMQHLKISRGDQVTVLDIVANYERGLSVDVIGAGNPYNDMKKKLIIHESTRIEAKKDFYTCGSVFLDVAENAARPADRLAIRESADTGSLKYKLKINGIVRILENNSHVQLARGDKLIIEDILTGDVDPSKYVVNFKGFVGNPDSNDGEDRGYVIDPSENVLMPRYSLRKKGRQYCVVTTLNEKEVGKLFIDIQL